MAGALTHASHHKHNRSNSSLTSRVIKLKRRYWVAVFVFGLFVVVQLFRRPRPPAGSVAFVQQKAYDVAPRRRPTCPWSTWNTLRYAPLSHPSRRITTFIAMNFYQNEEILPTFFQELPIIINQLGPENVFVSIYENNSDDKTQELLGIRA